MKLSLPIILLATLMGISLYSAEGALEINVGTHTVPAGTNRVQIPILISGADLVTDMAAAVQIGDGGLLLGAPVGPKIVSISYTGTIWSTAAGGFTTNATITLPSEVYDPNVSLNVSGQRVVASGRLLSLTVDTTGSSPGIYAIKLAGVGPTNATFDTQFQNSGTNVPVTIFNGRLAVGVVQIVRGTNATATLTFYTDTGTTYHIQWTTNLGSAWTEIPTPIPGTGQKASWIDNGTATGQPPGNVGQRFYRLRVIQ